MNESRRPLTPGERLVCIGAAVTLASFLLPWYGIRFSGLSATGFDSFGFGAVALIVTAGAAVVGVFREAAGQPPSRPRQTAELVIVAGVWAALIGVFLVFDRPDELAGSTDITPEIGVFVAVVGGLVIAGAGMRMRMERAAVTSAPE
jgi:hypothetical protein